MAGYAFARLRFPGRERVLLGDLAALAVPGIVLLVPRFLIIGALGWVDTYQGLISTELVSVGGIFLLRQFFRTLPRDLEDAAPLEGAGEWTDRKSTRLNSSHLVISYAVFCLKKKK